MTDIAIDTRNSKETFGSSELKAIFLVWGAPQGSHRSQFFAQELGIDVEHVYTLTRQGLIYALLKYPLQALQTLRLLALRRPRVVFVQVPPVFAALSTYLYSLVSGAKFILDSHTDALLASWWAWSLPLHSFLSRRAVTTIVTNGSLSQKVTQWGARAFVLRDPPITRLSLAPVLLDQSQFHVLVVSTVSYDEPIHEILAVARELPEVMFHVSGRYPQARPDIVSSASPNVGFTGYIPDEQFYGLMKAVQVVICLTTEDFTLQSGANEALWLGKPVITSDWPVLRECFHCGTIHVDNSAPAIRAAICRMMENLPDFEEGIRLLQAERREEWRSKAAELALLIQGNLEA